MAESEWGENEGFLDRWSRLKRAARVEAPAPEPPGAPLPIEIPAEPAERAEPPPGLPSVDSLDADSDYTAFLKQEVPAELRRLALRKAWASDPKIADFRGFGEYDWDYNAPGYGALRPTDNIKALVDAIFPAISPDEKLPEDGDAVVMATADPPDDRPERERASGPSDPEEPPKPLPLAQPSPQEGEG